MKTNILVAAMFIAALLVTGCAMEKNSDFKAVIVPQTNNSAASLTDLNKSAKIINNRLVNALHISHGRIKTEIAENQILLTVSGIDNSKIAMIKNMITGNAGLEFWETYENKEIIGALSAANSALKGMQGTSGGEGAAISDPVKTTPEKNFREDTLKAKEVTNPVEFLKGEPLFGILSPRRTVNGDPLPSCMVGVARGEDTARIDMYLNISQIKALFPGDLRFFWSHKPYKYDPSGTLYELHAIKVTRPDGQAPLAGNVITSAKAIAGPGNSDVKIDFTMNEEGAVKWATLTRENINRCIAVVINGHVRSYPRVMNEISGGNTEITGDFTPGEAGEIVSLLNSGELPFELKIVQEQIVGRE